MCGAAKLSIDTSDVDTSFAASESFTFKNFYDLGKGLPIYIQLSSTKNIIEINKNANVNKALKLILSLPITVQISVLKFANKKILHYHINIIIEKYVNSQFIHCGRPFPIVFNMNPICKTNINSPECQLWMSKVCTHCRNLFAKEATNTWADWWHDDTPALYKDVPEMTVYDCNKLKHLLELEVAALHPNKPTTFPPRSFHFKLWQKILLICIYVGLLVAIILICRYWKLGRREKDRPVDEEKEETPHSKSSKPESTPLPQADTPRLEKNRKTTLKGWMRYRCRPIFLHNEAALRRQQAKYREKELLREAYTQQNIEKWTKAREKVEKKRRERKSAQETKASEIRETKA